MSIHELDTNELPDGVTMVSTETEFCNCSWLHIEDENGVEAMGRPIGNYITIETAILEHGKMGDSEEIARTVSDFLLKLMNVSDDDLILVVGIGNRNVIADSLGVCVADKVVPTNHVLDELNEKFGTTSIRRVSVISPGVMGTTGMSTAEIIRSLCDEMKPSLVILVDSLAAIKTHRLYSTIQITDTGLTPSGGMGNKNARTINSDYLGVPVIGIGVPMVISVANIMIDFMGSSYSQAYAGKELEDWMIEHINEYADALFPSSSSFVAVKEIEIAVQHSAHIISTAINMTMFQDEWMQMPNINI